MRWRSGFHDLDRTLEEVRRAKGTLDTAAIMKRIFKGRVERVKMKKMIEKRKRVFMASMQNAAAKRGNYRFPRNPGIASLELLQSTRFFSSS